MMEQFYILIMVLQKSVHVLKIHTTVHQEKKPILLYDFFKSSIKNILKTTF